MSAQIIIIFSSGNFFLHASEYLLPSDRLFSSTLHTIILGLSDKRPDFLIKFLLNFFFNSSGFFRYLLSLGILPKISILLYLIFFYYFFLIFFEVIPDQIIKFQFQ